MRFHHAALYAHRIVAFPERAGGNGYFGSYPRIVPIFGGQIPYQLVIDVDSVGRVMCLDL